MKKFFLSIIALAAACSAMAIDFDGTRLTLPNTAPILASETTALPQDSRASDGFSLRFCSAPEGWLKMGKAYEIRQMIYVDADLATQLAGNKVASIGFSITLQGRTQAPGKICVWEDCYGSPVTSKDITIKSAYSASPYYQTQTFAADDQYVIKANTPFFFGTVFDCTENDAPIGVDYNAPSQYSGHIYCFQKGEYVGELDMAKHVGTNLVCWARTVGEKTEVNNVFTIGECSMGDFTLPVASLPSNTNISLPLKNYGINAITSVEYEYAYNGGAKTANKLDVNVAGLASATIDFPIQNAPTGYCEMTFNVTKINDITLNQNRELAFINVGAGGGYPRKFVIEEGTGTWCGFCPRGIVGLEYMVKQYGDNVVPIAVHAKDKFTVTSYNPVLALFPGYPSSIINRDEYYMPSPSAQELDACYQIWKDQRSPVMVDLEVNTIEGSKNLQVKAYTLFCINQPNADYRLAFVILEDGLVAKQTNNYAGGGLGAMGGWESMSSSQTWEYEHTARDIFDAEGIEGSIPSDIVANKTYEYDTRIYGTHITDVAKTQVVALVIEANSGTIVNATKVPYEKYNTPSGVDDAVIGESALPVEYYNLQGVKVANPGHGAYIRVQGRKATKVIL